MGERTPGDEFAVPVADLAPSQLYLDAASLRSVLEWVDVDDPDLDPLPVLSLPDDDGWYLADGHTRAFVAHLAGAGTVPVEVADPAALSLPVYERCLAWCREAGVTAVADLSGRVVSHERFLADWVTRCRALPQHPGSPEDIDGAAGYR